MESITKKEFNESLCNLRKAHRLIFTYQEKMLDLIHFIEHQFGFTEMQGLKHFSKPIRSKRSSYLEIWKGMWAWDFLYSYVFEYYLGELKLDNGDVCALSIIQYSDTGFFEIEDPINKADISSFEVAEKSESKLLFIFELKQKKAKDWVWNNEDIIYNIEYASKKHTHCIINNNKGNIQLLYSFSMDNFLNEKTTMIAIKEFAAYCEKEANVILL